MNTELSKDKKKEILDLFQNVLIFFPYKNLKILKAVCMKYTGEVISN